MRSLRAGLLAAAACLAAAAPSASAAVVEPKSAHAFRDSVGIGTHIVYYSTAYGDWQRAVSKLQELGVRHVRDGIYGNPAPQWRDWNERYYRAVDLAARRGMRFTFLMGQPGNDSGTLDQLVGVAAGRLRYAAEALEAPNEFDHFVAGRRWPSLLAGYSKRLFTLAKAHPSLRSLPVVAPSFGTTDGPSRFGDQSRWVDVGNIHPYTAGLSPDPEHLRSERVRASVVAGRKPVWATEVGFNNALRAGSDEPPVSESAAAVYTLRTLLEHFRSGISRTFLYELVDLNPDPGLRDPALHYGLLRSDFTPKPAFHAVKNLLAMMPGDDERPRLHPLRMSVRGPQGDLRRLVMQKADGTYLVALWRLASVWDPAHRRPLGVKPRRLTVRLPGARRVAVADPIASDAMRPLRLRGGRVRVELGARPLVLRVTPRHSG